MTYDDEPFPNEPEETEEDRDSFLFDYDVKAELRRLQVNQAARIAFAQVNARAADPFDAGLLVDVLARPDNVRWRIDGFQPAEARLLYVAQRKTGKTSIMLNHARCLLTGEDFLGRFGTRQIDGRVALINFEVSAAQIARWASDAGIPTDRLLLVNLRGRRNPLAREDDLELLVKLLRENEVQVPMLDPFARAFVGVGDNPNDTGQVNNWTALVDRLASDIGASEVVVANHTGWNQERGRNSTALEDWADVIVNLTRGDDGQRYLKAEGRDVEVEEDRLDFDPEHRRLTMSGEGSRKAAKAAAREVELVDAVVGVINRNPQGLASAELDLQLRVAGFAPDRGDGSKAARIAEQLGLVVRQKVGRKIMHLPKPDPSVGSVTLPHGGSNPSDASVYRSGRVTEESEPTLPQVIELFNAVDITNQVSS